MPRTAQHVKLARLLEEMELEERVHKYPPMSNALDAYEKHISFRQWLGNAWMALSFGLFIAVLVVAGLWWLMKR